MVDELESAMQKNGPELFRELLRLYPIAEVEDYQKNGAWRDDIMRVDLQLLDAHLKEAGADDPPPISEVKLPADLPKAGPLVRSPGVLMPAMGGVRPAGTLVPAKAGAAVATAGPVAELRLIALFVAKWKLDPTRTKMMLAKMTPQRRRYVIQNFKTTAQGLEATAALESYIAECDETNAWGAATAAPTLSKPVGVAAATAAAAAGVKRTLTPTGMDPSKRPRMMGPGSIAAKATGAAPATSPTASTFAARLAAQQQRPRAPGAVTPVRPGLAVRPALGGVRPLGATAAGGVRPGFAAPTAKAESKPGALIRNLLHKF